MVDMELRFSAQKDVIERVAGYDARNLSPVAPIWSAARRETYLYRLDVAQPFSADTIVWPSIFGLNGAPETRSRFGYQDTWAKLDELRDATVEHFQSHELISFHTIAITLMLGEYSKNDEVNWSSIIPPVRPDHRSASWSFLGFDVCDAWLLSALMNYGFNPKRDDVSALRETWGPLLNQFHLFSELQPAMAFKQLSDHRLNKDHTPCFVFGLWVVR